MHVSLRVFVYTALLVCCAPKIHAEGSKELSANGGSRAFWRSSTVVTDQFPFPYLGIIKVYANVGERIYLGSSAQGIGAGTITWRAPDGSTGTSGNSTTIGFIADRTEETLGPRLTTNGVDPGYNPYIVNVGAGQAGVWEITFNPTNPAVAGGTAPIVPANNPWTQNPNSWYIAAFDVSVRNAGNTAFINGRAYLNMFAGITSSVGANFGSFNGIFNILTRDGYQYTVNANGMQGVAFDFFVNNKGFRNASGDASYHSIAGIGTTAGTIPVHDPTMPDDATNVTYKLFFSTPNSDLPASAPTVGGQTTWLLATPVVPTLSNFTFTGIEGTPNQSGTAPLGGNFTFNSTAAGAYRISLDVNQNGIFTDLADRLLTGSAVIGNNTVAWDALDGEGNPVPGGTTFLPGSIHIELFSGEVHFPLLDVERNPTGIIVTRINGPGAPNNMLYWDDTNIPNIGTPSSPKRNLDGQSSAINGHIWNLNFGNDNGMDSWSYISSPPLLNTVNLVVGQADLEVVRITPSAAAFCAGTSASYEVEVQNNGPSTVANAPFNFRFPPTFTGATVTNAVTNGTVTLSGVVNAAGVYHADLSMSNGGTIVFTITGTVTGSSISTSADITRTADITDPDATNPDNAVPTDALAECDAAPSGAGCNNIKTSTVTVGSAVTNNTISAAQQICPGAVPAVLTGSIPTGGTGAFVYLWESSTTSSSAGFAAAAGVNNTQDYTPAALSATAWFRRVVNSGCSSTSTAIEITVTPPPAAPAAIPTQPTCAVATGTITVTTVAGLTYAINGTDYLPGPTFTNVAPGTYQVTARNAAGCTSTATQVVINAQPATPAAPTATPTQPTCVVATGTITVTTVAGLTYAINGTDYLPGPTFTNVAPGTYQVTARNAAGCTSTATQVVINAQPATPAAPAAIPTQPTCAVVTGTITVTAVAGLTYAINGTDYLPGPTFTNVAPGTYQVTARNAAGCTSTATQVVINAQPATPAAPVVANITYCQGDVATALTATGTNIKWYNIGTGGLALASPVIPSTTTAGVSTYWASQTNAGGCESPRASLTVTVFAKPTLQVTSSTADMTTTDARRELTGNTTGGNFSGTGVVTEAGRFYFNPATAGAGTHTLTYSYTGGGNCTVSITFSIRVTVPVADVSVTVVADNAPTGIGDPFNYTITASNNGPGTATNVVVTDVLPVTVELVSTNASAGTVTGNSTVTWNIPALPPNTSNTLTITVKPTQLGVIQNTVTIASSQTDNVPANNTAAAPKEIVGLKIPNVITPNGDGFNDRFVIKGLELYTQNQLTIINRWGNHVYEKRNYTNDWTGNGLAEGTYFYILRLTDRQGKNHDLKGYLMINR
ncbi:T9SS type B sorting domain-containing protein [Chitinophaga niabensis]|uniref:Conserved repeat domain-containing protein/gliding motility-associated C-terminal domain-containing protein n=1 Tax=Chitinophaga niabensis TaxID=536979 RepID=A0A1N6K0B3_9BACT|nr:gliding motility-associated C-terminal domain-containing protein [Chitinophaga niabensis]SIO50018.1 conserved repeat domain-containing protein/gliding motility-associated C-terminal domain-containing protein [Chitinophaga niabensis]